MRKTLVLLLLAPLAQAAEWEDPVGDQQAFVAGQWLPGNGWDGVDLVRFAVEEDPSFFRFHFQVADLSMYQASAKHDAAEYLVRFRVGDQPHAVSLVRNGLEDAWYGNLYAVEPGTGYLRWLGPLDVDASDADNGGWIQAPREAFRDPNGRIVGKGMALEDLTVNARAHLSGASCCLYMDGVYGGSIVTAMDDIGPLTAPVLYGGAESQGGVRLSTDHPFRASNGGAATYHFQVDARNTGAAVELDVAVQDVPDGWNVTTLRNLTLPAGGSAPVDVYVQTPFNHQHGGARSFRLMVHGGDAHAAIELGVHYLDVPQPSGHHSRLWLHSMAYGQVNGGIGRVGGGSDGRVFMNALEEDAADEAFTTTLAWWNDAESRTYVCLEPGLSMGLQQDLTRTGTLSVPLESDVPGELQVGGRLIHLGAGKEMRGCFPGGWGDREVTELGTFSGSGEAGHTIEAAYTPSTSRVAQEAGAQLVLEITVTAPAAGPGMVRLAPSGWLELPLDEYSDERPVGLIGDVETTTAVAPVVDADGPADKESPGASVAAVAGLLVVLAARRK